jgi:hypothetical protein
MFKFIFFFTLALIWGEWPASYSGHFNPKERGLTTQMVRIWMDPRACLDNMEKRKFWTLQGLELQPLGHPACSQSLSQLLTGTYWFIMLVKFGAGNVYPILQFCKQVTWAYVAFNMGGTSSGLGQSIKYPERFAFLVSQSYFPAQVRTEFLLWHFSSSIN